MDIFLIEPEAKGRISGGYLYNARMAAAPGLNRRSAAADRFGDALGGLPKTDSGLVLADSLFLTPENLEPLLLARRRLGYRIGVLLHAFPSFVERAQDRNRLSAQLPLTPTGDELDFIRGLDVVVTPGPYLPRLLERLGVDVPCAICPPGVHRGLPGEKHRRNTVAPMRLLSLGGVTPNKGLLDAIGALSGLSGYAYHYHIVGNLDLCPAYVRELRQLITNRGLGDRVELLGQVPHERSLEFLVNSEILLLPSYTENHPLVALEALANGVPVVGYDSGGIGDVVTHEHTGLLAPTLDEASLAALLRQLFENREKLLRLADTCRRAARSFPSWSEAASQFAKRLNQLFSENPAQRQPG